MLINPFVFGVQFGSTNFEWEIMVLLFHTHPYSSSFFHTFYILTYSLNPYPSTNSGMNPLRWYYMYSPKYEMFHHIFQDQVKHSKDFVLCPVFYNQCALATQTYLGRDHFLSGFSFKAREMVSALQHNPGDHILFSDIDILVNKVGNLRAYLEPYRANDLTYMRNEPTNESSCIAFGLIKSTPQTIRLFQKIVQIIEETGSDDQAVLNSLLPNFVKEGGTTGLFSMPEINQSNQCTSMNFYVMQMLCSNQSTYEANLYEKLLTAANTIDIRNYCRYIPRDVLANLIPFLTKRFPNHYLSTVDL